MRRFSQDDEIDVRSIENAMAEADEHYDMMGRDMLENRKYRGRLEKALDKKTIDPIVLKAIELAQELGRATGKTEALENKVEHLISRIKVRDAELDRTEDRDEWHERAIAAEATLERKAKLARRRR